MSLFNDLTNMDNEVHALRLQLAATEDRMGIAETLLSDCVRALNAKDNYEVREGLMSYDLAQALQEYLTIDDDPSDEDVSRGTA